VTPLKGERKEVGGKEGEEEERREGERIKGREEREGKDGREGERCPSLKSRAPPLPLG
jgi:hypothetical protein